MAVPDARLSVTMACRAMAVVIWVRDGIARLVEDERMQVGGLGGKGRSEAWMRYCCLVVVVGGMHGREMNLILKADLE